MFSPTCAGTPDPIAVTLDIGSIIIQFVITSLIVLLLDELL